MLHELVSSVGPSVCHWVCHSVGPRLGPDKSFMIGVGVTAALSCWCNSGAQFAAILVLAASATNFVATQKMIGDNTQPMDMSTKNRTRGSWPGGSRQDSSKLLCTIGLDTDVVEFIRDAHFWNVHWLLEWISSVDLKQNSIQGWQNYIALLGVRLTVVSFFSQKVSSQIDCGRLLTWRTAPGRLTWIPWRFLTAENSSTVVQRRWHILYASSKRKSW